MSTPFSSPFHHNEILRTKNYLAGSLCETSFNFNQSKGANVLTEIPDSPFIPDGPAAPDGMAVAVGMVTEANNKTDTLGNWTRYSEETYNKAISDAKFNFLIMSPDNDPTFASAFPTAIAALKKLQNSVAKTTNHRYLVVKVWRSGCTFIQPQNFSFPIINGGNFKYPFSLRVPPAGPDLVSSEETSVNKQIQAKNDITEPKPAEETRMEVNNRSHSSSMKATGIRKFRLDDLNAFMSLAVFGYALRGAGICPDHGAGYSGVSETYVGWYKASWEGNMAFLHSFDATLYWVQGCIASDTGSHRSETVVIGGNPGFIVNFQMSARGSSESCWPED
ncbi:hypothetical protein DFH08DRAFT_812449 [Mycena albidolilacea]|uniref:Uncharacterized protein n=1 Tax=Mycena albidolilacea TaxID=1033008 RepID=A0AAD7EN90_9AGAR|nr:hypothetical protein DFH08DRAFT_812449 [Mycena albidolilacea]